MADYVPLLIAGAVAYYVLVVNPSILSNLTGALTPAAAGGSTTPSGSACQGKDKTTGAACDCPATTAMALAYPTFYAYKSSKKKSSKSSSSKSSSSKSSKSSTSSGGSSTTQTSTSSSCDCSACGGATPAPTSAPPSGNSIWCKCVGGKWAQDPAFKGASVKCALIGQTCTGSTTGAAGYSDLNGYAGMSIANDGYGFNALQAYHRRYW